jgi:hypothetical protein
MDGKRFDTLARVLAARPASRRGMLRLLSGSALAPALAHLGLDAASAQGCLAEGAPCTSGDECCLGRCKKRKGKRTGKCSCPDSRECEDFCCPSGRFCCNPQDQIFCPDDAECCNVGDGTGSCCARPKKCAKPLDDETAPFECCSKERQWFTATGLVRCCREGTRSLGSAISSDDGPCCPEEKYCSDDPTGGKCCPDIAPVCVNKSKEQCCTEDQACGTKCCGFNQPCCQGKCCPFGQICDGGTTCKCPGEGLQCRDTCCHAAAVGCDGSRCLNQCDIDKNCGG